jgi:hypothetical protein
VPSVSSRKFQKQFYIFTLLGVLLLALGAVGVGFSQQEHRHVISDDITHTETYVDYETQTKTIIETDIIARASRLVSPPVEGADQPSEHSWHEVFPFNLDPKCTNYHLLVKASEAIYLTAILTSGDSGNGIRSLGGITLEGHLMKPSGSVPVKAWVGTKLIDETLDLAPGAYLLYFSAASALETSFSFHFEITQSCENIVTETVPVEKTREVTQRLDRWVTSKPYENLLWPALISIALGSGVLAYGVSRRKRAPVTIWEIPIDDMSCDQARIEKDYLVEEINCLNKDRDDAEKEAKESWDTYVKLDRKAWKAEKEAEQTTNEIKLIEEELERERKGREQLESNYERELKNPEIDDATRKSTEEGLARVKKDTKKIIDNLKTRLGEASKASAKAKTIEKEAGEARDAALKASENADKKVEDLGEEIRKHTARLKELIYQKRHCIDCCDIKELYNVTRKDLLKRSEDTCPGLRREAELYKKDADNASTAKEKASQEAQKCKDDNSYKEAVDEAKQKLKDFIDKAIFHDGITTDAGEAREKGFENMVGLAGLSRGEDVVVYFRGNAEAKFLAEYFRRGNLRALRRDFEKKRNELKNHEQECKKMQEKADREQREAEYAKIRAERANARSERCKEMLDDLKNQADFFESNWKECVRNLEECRNNIAELINEIKVKRRKLDECLNKFGEKVGELEGLAEGTRKHAEDYKDYPDVDFESIIRELDSAIGKHGPCLKKLKSIPKARLEEPKGSECGILEDCREIIRGLRRGELENVKQHLKECQDYRSTIDNDLTTLYEKDSEACSRANEKKIQSKCNEDFRRWIERNLKDDPEALEKTLTRIVADVAKTSAKFAEKYSRGLAAGELNLASLAKAGASAFLSIEYGLVLAWVEGHLRAAVKRIADKHVLDIITVPLYDRRKEPCGVIMTKGMDMKDIESFFFFRKGKKVFIYRITHMYGLEFLGVRKVG